MLGEILTLKTDTRTPVSRQCRTCVGSASVWGSGECVWLVGLSFFVTISVHIRGHV